MHKGDGIVCYSPKAVFEGSEPLHAFTAIGEVSDDVIFQVEESPDFKPFRRRVRYIKTGEVRDRAVDKRAGLHQGQAVLGLHLQVRGGRDGET